MLADKRRSSPARPGLCVQSCRHTLTRTHAVCLPTSLPISTSALLCLPACPPLPPAADCLAICAALAEGIPGRVAQELLSVCGVSPAVAAATPLGQAGEIPLLSRVLGAEGAAGCYPATQAFLRLLTTLVSGRRRGAVVLVPWCTGAAYGGARPWSVLHLCCCAGPPCPYPALLTLTPNSSPACPPACPGAAASPAPALQVLVVWVLHRVLAEHHLWRYSLRTERWRIASLALRLVRLALLSAPTLGGADTVGGEQQAAEGGSAIAAAVAAVLQYEVGTAACLLTALPPHAEQLEVSDLSELNDWVCLLQSCALLRAA